MIKYNSNGEMLIKQGESIFSGLVRLDFTSIF